MNLPNPASFRQLRPAVLGTPPVSTRARLFERRRLLIGFAIAAVFHISLGLAWWLTPPLRLKVGIDPRRWVTVVSIPPPAPVTPATAPAAAPSAAAAAKPQRPVSPQPQPLLHLPAQPQPLLQLPSQPRPAAGTPQPPGAGSKP